MGKFQFVVLSTLRAKQLRRGCIPRIDGLLHKDTVIAQLEVSAGLVVEATPALQTADPSPAFPELEPVLAAV